MKKIFTLSEKASLEYSAAICRIGEVKPIKGSEFLGQTIVFGQSLVVRKDEMKEGDIVLLKLFLTKIFYLLIIFMK